MATFSGDAQYTQNGTVTNPCFPHVIFGFLLLLDPPEVAMQVMGPEDVLPARFLGFHGGTNSWMLNGKSDNQMVDMGVPLPF